MFLMSTIDIDALNHLIDSLLSGVEPSRDDILSIYNDGGIWNYISSAIGLLFFIPSLSISIRRLHDSGHSGWWMLPIIILFSACYIGYIVMLIFALQPSQPTENKYGPVPNLE